MPNCPFDRLPSASSEKRLRETIKQNLNAALCSFQEFIESTETDAVPDFPSPAVLENFMAQLRAFQSISRRKATATPIQLIREIDHRWRMKIFLTLTDCAVRLEQYLASNPLHNFHARVLFRRAKTPLKDEAVALLLLLNERRATRADLAFLRPLISTDLGEIIDSLSTARPRHGARQDAVDRLRDRIARVAQKDLVQQRELFLIKAAAAKPFRQFLFDLQHRLFQKRLFGLSDERIKEWQTSSTLAKNRLRKRRFDDRKRAKQRYMRRRHKRH